MSNITPFSFEKHQIRVVAIDGDPWFVGKDVCDALGYKDANNAMKQHCKGVAKHHPLLTDGGIQKMRVISEPDVMRLIVRSTLPAAEAFERLVFETILPQVRKTGAYLPDGLSLDKLPPAIASQIGGIVKAVVNQEIADAIRSELPHLLNGALAEQQISVRHGKTAGQLWKEYNLPPKLKNASRWFGYRLAELNCQIDMGDGSQSNGIRSTLFDPDKVANSMKGGLLAYCRQYAQRRMGQTNLFPGVA